MQFKLVAAKVANFVTNLLRINLKIKYIHEGMNCFIVLKMH